MKFKSAPLEGHTQLATAVGLSTQGTNVCSASADGTCRVWRVEEAICIFELPGDKRVACCNFSADGRMIITGDWGYQTRMWDAVEGQLVMSLAGHSGKLTASRFRADGNLMLTTSEDKHMRTWDPRRGVSVAFQAPDELLDGAFAPDMTTLVGACKNGKLLVWDVRKPDATKLEIAAHGTDWVTACAVAPGGYKVLTCSTDRTMKLWNLDSGAHLQTFEGHQEAVNGCRFLEDYVVSGAGNRFWGSKDNTLIVWDANTGQAFRTLKGHSDAIMGIDTCCYNGKLIVASASMDKSVRIWNGVSLPTKKKDEGRVGKGSNTDCRFGCGIQLPIDKMAFHEESCPQRSRPCPACRKEMTARELEGHLSECSENQYECVCGVKVRNKDRKRHEREECPEREVECKRGCGMLMKMSSMDEHVEKFCPERLVKCRLCSSSVPAKSLVSHQQNGCQKREITCDLCRATLLASEADQHRRRHCPRRQVQCRLGCGENFPAEETQSHEEKSCRMRLVTCTKGCGQACAAKDLPGHERACKGHAVGDASIFRLGHPLSSVRRPPPLNTPEDSLSEGTSPASSLGSPLLLPEIESPGRRLQQRLNCSNAESPLASKSKCSACGHSERHCSSCLGPFCSRCLVRSGLPKSNPPMCATCSRENNQRTRELNARSGPSPMKFG